MFSFSLMMALACGERAGDFARGEAAYNGGDYATARHEFTPLANAGNPQAQFYLGRIYELGYGTTADGERARQYYEQAAAQGIGEARNNLGVMYRDGRGVAKDPGRAHTLFESAARMENDDAQLSLGALYATGMGTERDRALAHAWYTVAAENGNEAARGNLAALEREMSRGERNEARQQLRDIRAGIASYDPMADPLFAETRQSARQMAANESEVPENDQENRPMTPVSADTGSYVRLKVFRLMDNTGFGQPVEAARFLAPADWRMEGGIQWSPSFGCLQMLVNAQFSFVAPDGITGVEVFPNYAWNWYDDPYQRQLAMQTAQAAGQRPCDMAPPAGAADFLRGKLLPAFRRGAQVVAIEPQPEVARASHASMQAYMQQAAAYGLQMDLRADAARVRLSYAMNGQQVEEWISATVQYNKQQILSASAAAQGGMGYTSSYTMTATAQIGTRAPAGRLDGLAPLFATMIASYRPNVAYVNAVSQVMSNIGNTQIQGAVDRSRIWSQANREISDIIRQGYDRQQQSQDRIAESWSQTTRGVETFVDPSTNERVELTGGYSQVWSNGNGEYVLSNSPDFEPNRVLQGNWREMQRPR